MMLQSLKKHQIIAEDNVRFITIKKKAQEIFLRFFDAIKQRIIAVQNNHNHQLQF
jgi:hypothetical protein